MKNMSESANSAKSAKQIFANFVKFVKFVKPIFGTTRRSVGSVTEAEYPTNYQRISNLSLTIRPFRVAILAVLLVFVGSWNSEVWGGTVNLNVTAQSSPTEGGFVYVNTTNNAPSSYSKTWDDAPQDGTSIGTKWTGYTTVTKNFYLFASAADDYSFKGWSKNASDNSGNTTNGYHIQLSGKNNDNITDGPYYAIFAKFKPSTTNTKIDFGDVAYNTGTHTKEFTIDCHNVGTWSNPSGLSGMLSASLSNNTDDNTQHTCTVTVSLNTTTAGTYNQTLKVTTSRGGTINVTVTAKVTATPSYTWSSALNDLYVGQTVNDVIEFTSSGAKTYSIENWTPTVSNNNEGATKPTFANNTLVCGQAGTLTLRIAQDAENNGFEAGGSTRDITIKKRPNTIKVKGVANYSSSINVDSYDSGLTITADNTDYTGSPISVKQAAGTDIATYYPDKKVVYSSYKLGTATWTLSQPENYKYQAGSGSFTVNVIAQDEATDCYVLENQSNSVDGWHGNTYHEHTWNDENAAGVVRFEISKTSGIDQGYKVQQKIGGNWVDVTDYKNDHSTSWGDWKTQTLNRTAKGVRFMLKGGSLNHVRNVSVTRATYLEVSNITIDRTSTGNPVYPSDGTGVGTLTINYSLANGGDLKITNDNPDKFTLSKKTISNVDCKTGTATINISYESDEAGTDVAHLVIYNKVYRKEVTITGITSKRNQTITWNVGNAIQVLSEIENAASVSANTEITYSTNNSAVIAIENGKLVAKGVGEATITVNAPGDDEYNAVEGSKTITVTSDLVQHIVWNQSLLGLHTGDADKTLNAYATSDVDGCTTNGGRAITYSSSDESVVKIVNGNKLRVIGKGTAYVTASQAGGLDDDGHTYMAVIEERKAIVRDPSDPCEAYVYQQTGTATMDLGWNWLSQQDRDTEIALSAEPDQMTFRYKFEKKSDLVGVKYGGGTMYVEQKIGNNDWTKVGDDLTPSEGSYQTATVNLDRHATKVRIRAHGVGYHSFTDCQISMLRYIETSELATFEAKVGQEAAQNMTLSYSNITGPVTLILGHTPSNFSVSQTAIEGSCGDHNSVNITVTYTPIAATEEETELLRISDGVTTHDISLTGVATVTNRYISWDIPSPNSVYTVETVNLSAQALTSVGNSPAGSVFYTKGELSTTGNLSGSTLTFSNDGVAYIAAQGVADPKYNATDIITKTFNVSKTPTSISVAPTVETIVSGTAAEDVVLNTASAVSGYDVNGFSGTVPGTWSVIEEDLNTVGENRSIKIHFEPSNTDMFIGCDGYINNVTVSQREATEEEVIGVASAITYGQTAAEASTLSNDGTLAGTWEWIDERADDVLAVYTYTDMQARFTPENGNIQPKVVNVSLTVNKANPVATVNAVEITYGATAASVDLEGTGLAGEWTWTDSRKDDVLAVGEYTMNVHFKPTDLTNYNEKDATVALTVKKADPVAAANAVEITYGATASSVDLEGTGVAGTWSWTDTRKDDVLAAGSYTMDVHFVPNDATNYNEKDATVALTVKKATTTLSWTSNPTDLAYNATDAVYTATSASDGAITYSIISGGSYAHIHANTGALIIDEPGNTITVQAAQAEGTNYSAPTTITVEVTIAAAPVGPNTFTNNARDNDWQNAANWSNGVPTGDEPDVIISGDLIIDEKLTVGKLTIDEGATVTVTVTGNLTIGDGNSYQQTDYGDLHVADGGSVTVGNGVVMVRDFILDASLGDADTQHAASGQFDDKNRKMVLNRNAYFDLSFDPSEKISYGWYDFTVPFTVNVSNGISRIGTTDDRQMVHGVDFMVMEADEANRANGGRGWRNVSGGVLQPGKLYTITFDYQESFDQNTFRFKWNGNGTLTNGATANTQYTEGSEETLRGWNGLGNGMLRHGYVNSDYKMQAYSHTSNTYELVEGNKTFAVGSAFFIQVPAAETIEWTKDTATNARPMYAPQREAREVEEFRLTLNRDEKKADVLYLSASEDATEAYVIGRDLLKMGTPAESKVARMWATKGGKNLCDVEAEMVNNNANTPLTLFAPQAGSYELRIDEMPEDATLYLTYNGSPIWNLNNAPYMFELEKGTTEGYGLRIYAHNAPQIATGVEEVASDKEAARKVLIDEKIYIITPQGAMYDITGKFVK